MAAKTDTRPYALIDLYVLVYSKRFNRKPTVNKYRDRWGFIDMIESIGYERCVEVVKYYVSLDKDSYSLSWLFNNFDRLDEIITERDADRARREKIRLKTKQRTEEIS
jgi:hypothetical protein